MSNMTKKEFFAVLEKKLSGLPKEERENAVRYYEEFFEDAESDEKAVEMLGDPKKIAEEILSEGQAAASEQNSVINPTEKKQPKSGSSNAAGIIILLILTFPLWVGFAAAAFGIFIALISVAFTLLVVFGTVGVACIAAGVATIFIMPPSGLIFLGTGLLLAGITLLALLPLVKLVWKFIVWCVNKAVDLFSRLFGRKEASA